MSPCSWARGCSLMRTHFCSSRVAHWWIVLHSSWLHPLKRSPFPQEMAFFLFLNSFLGLVPAHRKSSTQRPLFLWMVSVAFRSCSCACQCNSLKNCGFPKNSIGSVPLKPTSTVVFFKSDRSLSTLGRVSGCYGTTPSGVLELLLSR